MVVVQVGHYRDRCGLFIDGSGSGRSSQTGVDCLVVVVVQVGHYRDGCGLFSDGSGSGRSLQRQVWTV